MTPRRFGRAGLVTVWLFCAAGCGNSPTSPTSSTDTTTITSPVSVSFPGAVGPGGSASRSFNAQVAGTVRASVSAIAPATPLSIGLGVPNANGTGCLLALSSVATNGTWADISGEVAVGTYCVQVFAPAQAATTVSFTVALEHP